MPGPGSQSMQSSLGSSPVVLFYQIPKPGPVLSGSRGPRSRVSIKVVGRVLGVCRCEEAMAPEINL